MKHFFTLLALNLGASFSQARATAAPEGMQVIPSGAWRPFFSEYRSKEESEAPNTEIIENFYLDIFPVTNAQFYHFIVKNPSWSPQIIEPLFADSSYLKHAPQVEELATKGLANRPVTNISWFAARAYCEGQGKRLPTQAEWEYAGEASETKKDGHLEEQFRNRILKWYSKPSRTVPNPVGSTYRNLYGIYDMHGLVWEWVDDFNSSLITGESREDISRDQKRFCGSGSSGSKDPEDYAAFMRYAFRSSLQGDYTVGNLGFRCARSL